jgi:hypothetical protein
MKPSSHYGCTPATPAGNPPRRAGRRRATRLRGVIAVGVLLLALLATPGAASAQPIHFVLTQNSNGTISVPVPCQPGKGLGFAFQTPVGSFPAFFCKLAIQFGSQPPIPPFNTFALQVNTSPFDGIVNVTGTVVSLTVIGHTAQECDLVQTSNSPLIPAGSGLRVALVDGNWPSFGVFPFPAGMSDRIAAFVTPPPGPACPVIPITTQPVTSGGVIIGP